MEASDNVNTIPMHPRFDFEEFEKRITEAVTDNDRVMAAILDTEVVYGTGTTES